MDKKVVATIKDGKLEGEFQNEIYVFKGIPYAKPPVGNLRWSPPQPISPWNGIISAKQYGAMAPQVMPVPQSDFPGMPNFGIGNIPQSEDCLYLNIWTPGLDNALRPVMLWIHGGAFTIGAGSEAFLEKGTLVKRGDIVLVSINYRLGATGFLNLNEITGGKIPSTGNEGILDQVAALEWIQENIAAFGGNPDNVTISGFSAGGMSVGTLLGFPPAKDRFHKAMNRSGAANIVNSLEDAVETSEIFLKTFKLKGSDTDAIKNLTIQQLLDGQQNVSNELLRTKNTFIPFRPVVDGKVLPKNPMVSIINGIAKGIPVMAGTSRDERKYADDPSLKNMDNAGLISHLKAILPEDIVPGLVKAYRNSSNTDSKLPTPADIYSSISNDMIFRIPTIRLVEAQRDTGARTYNYLFTYRSPARGGVLGAMHGLDNHFMFGELDKEFTGNDPEQQSLAEKIQDSCISFVHNRNPSCNSTGEWVEYGQERMTMIFDKDSRIVPAPFDEERRAWDKYEFK